MSRPSNWPLTPKAIRFIFPIPITEALAKHPLSCDLYPTSIGYYPKALGHSVARNDHDDYLFLYCVDGKGCAEAKGQKLNISPGDLMVFTPNISHKYRALDTNPWSVYWIHFQGKKAKEYMEHIPLSRNRWHFSLGLRAEMESAFKFLTEVRHTPYKCEAAIHSSHVLRQLICYLSLLLSQTFTRGRLNLDSIHHFMERRMDTSLRLDELSKLSHLSKYQFVREYRKQTGTSPIAHFIRLKMKRACTLLDTTPLSIKEISESLGFDDAYYFSRVFKKTLGFSPEYYRNLKRG